MFEIYDKKTKKFKGKKIANRPSINEGATDVPLPVYNMNFQEAFFNEEKNKWEIHDKPNEAQLLVLKSSLTKRLNKSYENTRKLHIKNGYTFTIDLSSDEGKELINIINKSIVDVPDLNSVKEDAFKSYPFFIKIQVINEKGNETEKLLEIFILNWLWKYIFEEIINFTIYNKKLYEKYKEEINNTNDVDSLKNFAIEFNYPEGLTLNVNNILKEIMQIATGKQTDYYRQYYFDEKEQKGKYKDIPLQMPKTVLNALMAETQKEYPIFTITDVNKIQNEIKENMSNSFFI
jgi:hypothetical protein